MDDKIKKARAVFDIEIEGLRQVRDQLDDRIDDVMAQSFLARRCFL